MKEKLIVLGAGIMQGPALRIARELGFFTAALDGSAAAPCIPLADQFEQIDLKNKEDIETFARSLQRAGGLGGIMTAGTDFSASAAWAAERLDLPGVPYEAALNASDKSRMRACFKKAGVPSPEFITVSGADALEKQDLPGAFPLVVKPVDNMGGRGCRRVDSLPALRQAAADALRFSRSGRAIVEEFMEGAEFSVDAIVYRGGITICGLADRHIFFPPYFIEMGHTMPSAADGQEALLETFRTGIRALGLAGEGSVGAAKGDIKLTPQGPMIGEIAARLSGGYMSGWTYPYSSGIEPTRAAILAAMGRAPGNLQPVKGWTSAERAFISIPGTAASISGIAEARNRPFIQDVFLRAAAGGKVSFPENNVGKCGNVISAAPDRADAASAADAAARSIMIRLDPADPETAEFLAGGTSAEADFPPGAFQLGPELRAALCNLPEPPLPAVSAPPADMRLIAFPELASSGLTDYMGRTVAESLQLVRETAGLPLPEIYPQTGVSADNKSSVLGRSFWTAFVRGGCQGALYYIDRLGMA